MDSVELSDSRLAAPLSDYPQEIPLQAYQHVTTGEGWRRSAQQPQEYYDRLRELGLLSFEAYWRRRRRLTGGDMGYGTIAQVQPSAEHQISLHWLMPQRLRHRPRRGCARQTNELWLAPEFKVGITWVVSQLGDPAFSHPAPFNHFTCINPKDGNRSISYLRWDGL